MKPVLLAPLGLAILSGLGVVSGALAAPRHFVAVSAYVTSSDVVGVETGSEGNARTLLGFTRSGVAVVQSQRQAVWTCGAVEASAVGGSYKRCDWRVQ